MGKNIICWCNHCFENSLPNALQYEVKICTIIVKTELLVFVIIDVNEASAAINTALAKWNLFQNLNIKIYISVYKFINIDLYLQISEHSKISIYVSLM